MANHRKSLNACVQVPALLDLLGCHSHLQGMPLRTRCPVCREGVLTILHDHVCGGGWHQCAQCGSRGDLIALTSAALKVSVPETITHLAARGFSIPTDDASIRRYQSEHVEYDARLGRLWKSAAASNTSLSDDFSRLAHRLGLNPSGWRAGWRNRIGQLIRGLNKTEVEEAFAPEVMEHAQTRGESGSTSSSRVFQGEDWGVVAAVPFFDLPGRIASFLLIGRDADPKADFVLKRANRGPMGNQHLQPDAEAGLAFDPGIFEAAETMNRTLLAVSDPVAMLKLQARHFQLHTRPLPLVAWFDSDQWPAWQTLDRRTRTCFAWPMMQGHKVVFWAPNGITVPLLRQVIAADGFISTAGPRSASTESLKEFMWKRTPTDLWHHIVKRARPWPEALTADLEKCKDVAIDAWLAQIEQERLPLDPILARCGARAQERINRVIHAASWPRTIEFQGHTIVEANRSWSFQRNGRPASLVCDAILRLDRLLSDGPNGLNIVQGRILYRTHEVPVHAPLKDIEKDPFAFMRDTLLDEGLGLMVCDRRFAKHALQIAMQFQPPQHSQPMLRVGFDGGSGRLVLPNFTLAMGGQLEATTAALVPDHIPATNITVQATDRLDSNIASDSPAVATLSWAIIACVVSNIIASELQEVPVGLCLAGRGAQAVGMAVAEALGCLRLSIDRAADVQVALEAEQTHEWPIVFETAARLHRRQQSQLLKGSEEGRRCIIGTDWLTSRLLALRGGWNVITSEEELSAPASMRPMISGVLVGYLRDLVGRSCCLRHTRAGVPLALRVLQDLADFVEQHGGDCERVLSAADVLLADGDEVPPHLLLDVLGKLVSERRLQFGPEPATKGAPIITDVPARDTLALTHETLVRALSHLPVNLLDFTFITELLENSGVYRCAFRDTWLLHREAVLALWAECGVVGELRQTCG